MIILDTIWLLKESNPDIFLVYLKFILGIFLILSIIFFNQYVFKNKKKFSENIFIILIIFFILVEFIFVGMHSAFDWQSIHEIPIIKKDLNPLYLKNDFYTENTINTPKIIYAKFINLINILNVEIDYFLFFCKLLIIFLTPIYTFKILTNFNNNSKYYLYNNNILTISLSFVFSLGYFTLIDLDLGGWRSFISWKFVNPMTISNLICLFVFHNIQKNDYKNYLNYILLFIATILHATTPIFYFILFYFLLNKHNTKKFIENILLINLNKLLIFAPILVGSILIIMFFYSPNEQDNKVYSNIYNYIRHPHHYLVSSYFTIYSLLWISIPLVFLFIFFFNKNYIGIKISIYFSVVCFCSVLFQYFFTEIYIVNLISTKLSPIRFQCYSFFIYIILLNIFFSQFFSEIKFSEHNVISRFYNFFILLFLIFILLTIKKEPLHRSPDANKILNFIETNNAQKYYSDLNSEFILSFARSFNNKEIFADNLWIFDEKVSLQWLELKEKGHKIRILKDYNLMEFKCELNKYNVDAYIINKNFSLNSFGLKVLYENDTYLIYYIDGSNC